MFELGIFRARRGDRNLSLIHTPGDELERKIVSMALELTQRSRAEQYFGIRTHVLINRHLEAIFHSVSWVIDTVTIIGCSALSAFVGRFWYIKMRLLAEKS